MAEDFEDFLKTNPDAKFSHYYVHKLVSILSEGQPHGALGSKLYTQQTAVDFEDAGRKEFDNYKDWFNLTPDMKVIDYGCGSFRVGLHFIRFLDPGHYFGLDLTDDFIRLGLEVLSDRLGPDWQAEIGNINERLNDAVTFDADFVFSSNVAYHVHPDECAEYFAALGRLSDKAGAILCFDGRVAQEQLRFGDRNWAHTFEFHSAMLPDLTLVRTVPPREKINALLLTQETVRVVFHFER